MRSPNNKHILAITLLAIISIVVSPAGMASETVVLGGPNSDVSNLDEAIQDVNGGGEIIIRERYKTNGIKKYEGATINNGKTLTITGDGAVPIVSSSGDEAPIVVEDNSDRTVTLNNLILAGESEPGNSNTPHGIKVNSNSIVNLNNVSFDSSIDGTPISLNDNVASNDPTGAIVNASNLYYPSGVSNSIGSFSSSDNVDFVQSERDDPATVSKSLEVESINNPDSLIFKRSSEPEDTNPVLNGELDENIVVDGDNGDDESVYNSFSTLEAAIRASSERAVIDVKPHDSTSGGPYDLSDIGGSGVSEQKELTIRGDVSTGEDRPRVAGFDVSYSGEYTIEDFSITNGITVSSISADVDATNNFWQSANGPDGSMIETPSRETGASITTEPFCIDASCSGTAYDDYPICLEIRDGTETSSISSAPATKVNCQGVAESDVTIKFHQVINPSSGDANFYTDKRVIPYTIESNLTKRTTVEFDLLRSDSETDEKVTMQIDKDETSGSIEATYGGRISRMISQQVDFNPVVGISVQDRTPINKNLGDEVSLLKPDDDTDNVRLRGNEERKEVNASIIGGRFDGKTTNQTKFVTRYNGGSDVGSFQTNSIPPNEVQNGQVVDASRGSLVNFENLRTSNGRPAIITPNSPVNIGFSIDNIPPADQHTLNITYGYQAEPDPQNNMNLRIVDETSTPIVSTAREQLEPTAAAGSPSTAPDLEDIDTEQVSIPLTPREVNYINEQGTAYITISNTQFTDPERSVLYLYNAKINTTDNIQDEEEDSTSIDQSEDNTIQEALTSKITATLSVDGTVNPEYGTYDVEPGEKLDVTITIQNNGESSIESDYELVDDYAYPDEAYPGQDRVRDVDRENNSAVADEFTATLEPGETQEYTRTFTWSEREFGEHEVKLYKVEDNGDRTPVASEQGGQEKFVSYVFQETTLEIVNLETPSEHLVYDNFDTSVTLQNVGDLEGSETLNVEFGSWSSTVDVTLGPGDVRAGETSQKTTLRFARDIHPDPENDLSFTRREYTTKYDVITSAFSDTGTNDKFEVSNLDYTTKRSTDKYRPNAPFHTETGEFVYRAEVENYFEDSQQYRSGVAFNSINEKMSHEDSSVVSLYELQLDNFNILTNPEADSNQELRLRPGSLEASVYASAWPYGYPSGTDINNEDISNPSVSTYSNENPVKDGEGTLFSADSLSDRAKNRVSVPVNENDAGVFNEPTGDYLSIYSSQQLRACNQQLLSSDNDKVQVLRGGADEGDVTNSFLAFSAQNGCDDTQRITNIHSPVFVGNVTYEDDQVGIDSTQSIFSGGDPANSILRKSVGNSQNNGIYNFNATAYNDFSGIVGGESSSIMYATVTVSNAGNSQPATARLEIVTNKSISGPQVVGLSKPSDSSFESAWGVPNPQFQDEVVGAAAVRLQPRETQRVQVPLIIRNVEDVGGTHVLSVRPRAAGVDTSGYQSEQEFEDYLDYNDRATPPEELDKSPITNEYYTQFEIPINVTAYGDTVLKDTEPIGPSLSPTNSRTQEHEYNADIVANEVCRNEGEDGGEAAGQRKNIPYVSGYTATPSEDRGAHSPDSVEGINVQSGRQSTERGVRRTDGECNYEGLGSEENRMERVKIKATWTNHGGEEMTIEPEAMAEFEPRSWYSNTQRLNAHATGDRFLSTYTGSEFLGSGDITTFSQQSASKLTLEPGDTKSVTFSRKFQEPGLYHLRVAPCRDVAESSYSGADGPRFYDLEGFTGIPDTLDDDTGEFVNGADKTVHSDHSRISGNPSDSSALQTTVEMNSNVYHGARGCASKTVSAFIYDVTNPVADFRVAHDETTKKATRDNIDKLKYPHDVSEYTHALPSESEEFGFDGANPQKTVNIAFAVDQSGSVSPFRDDIREDIISFVEQNPSYNYGYERFCNEAEWASKDIGEYDSSQEFINYMKKDTGARDATIGGCGFRNGDQDRDSLTDSKNQLINNGGTGPNIQNYIIIMGDGDQLQTTGCDDPLNVDPSASEYDMIGVWFDGRGCYDNLRDESSIINGERQIYDTSEPGSSFISAFEQVNRNVIGSEFQVKEGGMLFLDGSSTSRTNECGNCYSRPHYEPYELETPADSKVFPRGDAPNGRNDAFRYDLRKNRGVGGVVHSYQMSTDNARITGDEVPSDYFASTLSGQDHPSIDYKGMEWTIQAGSGNSERGLGNSEPDKSFDNDPNYGQKDFCEEVYQDRDVDQHCYMEKFHGQTGSEGNNPDFLEVVPHRFTDAGEREVKLKVQDDNTLTRQNSPNSNITTRNVDVIPDKNPPSASIGYESFNTLSYDHEDSAGTVWHRMENIFDDISYRGDAPDNFDSKYDDTYEGTQTCVEVTASDDDVGISQDRWSQKDVTDDVGLDHKTQVIDSGYYRQKDGSGDGTTIGVDQWTVDQDMDESRDGDRRCVVFEEANLDDGDTREQIFEYTAWDYVYKQETVETDPVTIENDDEKPTIEKFETEFATATGSKRPYLDYSGFGEPDIDAEFNRDMMFAAAEGYSGGNVRFEVGASDDRTGVACIDIQFEGASDQIKNNCQVMGSSASGEEPIYGGPDRVEKSGYGAFGVVGNSDGPKFDTYGFTPGPTLQDFIEYDDWWEWLTKPDTYKLHGYISAKRLGITVDDIEGQSTTREVTVHVVDWHGNHAKETKEIVIKKDTGSPSISSSVDCESHFGDPDDEGDEQEELCVLGLNVNSGGTNGGTPIKAVKVKSETSPEPDITEKNGGSAGFDKYLDEGDDLFSNGGQNKRVEHFGFAYTVDEFVKEDDGGFEETDGIHLVQADAYARASGCVPRDSSVSPSDLREEAEASGSIDATIVAIDEHGNKAQTTVSAYARASASDTPETCPPPEPA